VRAIVTTYENDTAPSGKKVTMRSTNLHFIFYLLTVFVSHKLFR